MDINKDEIMKYLNTLFFLMFCYTSINAQLFEIGSFGTFEDKESTYKKIENYIKENNCKEIWKLCSEDLKSLYDKNCFCDSIAEINRMFQSVENNKSKNIKSGGTIGDSYYVVYYLLPEKWFGILSHDNHNNQVERELYLEFTKVDNKFYLDSIKLTNDYLKN